MRLTLLAAGIVLVAGSICAAAAPPAPAFVAKPTATRTGDKTRIDFSVDRKTDVAVFIEDAAGKVVRHLVAGVLGDNPPAPLKPGLAQSIEWDGLADYGKPAGNGPFKVRVALGMGAKYDKILLDAATASTGSGTVGVGPDGTVYIPKKSNTFGGSGIVAFNRDGSYLRTVAPFPADLPGDRVRGFDVFALNGRPAPLPHNTVHGLYPQPAWGSRKHQLPVSSDGKIYFVGGKPGKYNKRGLSTGVIHTDGSCPDEELTVELKPAKGVGAVVPDIWFMGVALSGDEKSLYVAGLTGRGGKVVPVVFRIALPQRDTLDIFFGDPAAAGKSNTQLSAPRGLAVDGKGHLLIADRGNDRIVVVNESDGKFVAEVAVDNPDFIAVDRKTGHIYVTRPAGRNVCELLKLSGWKDARVVAKVQTNWVGHGNCPPAMDLDTAGDRPVVWLQEDYGRLKRVEDLGDKFGAVAQVSEDADSDTGFMDVTVDRFRNEVYMRGSGRTNGPTLWWYRYDEAADSMERLKVGPFTSSSGAQLVPGPDGTLYAPSYVSGLFKFTHDGKPSPWADPIRSTTPGDDRLGGSKMSHCTFMPVSECWMRHVLGVRPSDGHIFAFEPGRNGGRPTRMLREYLPSGQLARAEPVIWKVSDGSVGPKFDPQGNIYIAEIIKPADQVYPPEFVKALGPVDLKERFSWGSAKDSAANIYGSIVKFSPKGGMVDISVVYAGVKSADPYDGEPKLDPSLRTEPYVYHNGAGRLDPVKVTGAEWVRMGVSHVFVGPCTCDSTRFDVDEFGRVWAPDQGRFRINVLDTNGNDLTHFGGYGNADSPGKANGPEIAFSWLMGVGVTDRYIYTGDSLNRRLMRSRITYAAEETCPIK